MTEQFIDGTKHHQYKYTTIDYEHPDPSYRTSDHVSVHLQMDYDEIVAGARINAGRPLNSATDQENSTHD